MLTGAVGIAGLPHWVNPLVAGIGALTSWHHALVAGLPPSDLVGTARWGLLVSIVGLSSWDIALVVGIGGLALFSYSISALDRRGAMVSFGLGLLVALFQNLSWVALMVAFTVMGVLATRIGYGRKNALKIAEPKGGERGMANVIANGAPAALAALAGVLVGYQASALAFAAAIAAASADTLASELGSLSRRARLVIPPFGGVPPGIDGAVSWPGQAAAAGGAGVIALLSVPLLGIPATLAWIPFVAGFLGCQLDSLLGATLERTSLRDGPLSNEDVNFIAGVVPALVVLVAFAL